MSTPPADRRPRRSIPFAVLVAAVVAVQVVIIGAFALLVPNAPL